MTGVSSGPQSEEGMAEKKGSLYIVGAYPGRQWGSTPAFPTDKLQQKATLNPESSRFQV